MTAQFKYFREVLEGYSAFSDETWSKVESLCSIKSVVKGEHLDVAGEKAKSFYFLNEGLVRSYIISDEGKEITKVFFDKGGLPGNIVSMLKGENNKFFIEALEDCSCIEISFDGYRELLKENFELAKFHIAYIERHWIMEAEVWDLSQRSDEAGERYEFFKKRYPQILDRITLGQIASYLGISQTQLSRIRKKS